MIVNYFTTVTNININRFNYNYEVKKKYNNQKKKPLSNSPPLLLLLLLIMASTSFTVNASLLEGIQLKFLPHVHKNLDFLHRIPDHHYESDLYDK